MATVINKTAFQWKTAHPQIRYTDMFFAPVTLIRRSRYENLTKIFWRCTCTPSNNECSRSGHSKFGAQMGHTDMLFLLLCPWPWPDDLGWLEDSEDVPAYQNELSRPRLSELADRQTVTHDRTHYHVAFTCGNKNAVVIFQQMHVFIVSTNGIIC